jgi:hypothetical protein
MSDATGHAVDAGSPAVDPDVLREQIEQTRAELGETVEALAAKTDVKAQAKAKLAEGKEQLRQVTPARLARAPMAAVGALSAVVFAWLLRRRAKKRAS